MDYAIINGVIEEIINIVNKYNQNRKYSYQECCKLVIALFGYYLTYGEGIFKKINTILEKLNIYTCKNKDEYLKTMEMINDNYSLDYDVVTDCSPIAIFDYKYDVNNRLIDTIPNIVYIENDEVVDVLTLIHELSHLLEITSRDIVDEDENKIYIHQGFADVIVHKEINGCEVAERGMTEFVAVCSANTALKEFLKLDIDSIDNEIIKGFLGKLKKYRQYGTMIDSYSAMSIVLKDLIDNSLFIEIIRDCYYDNDEHLFKERYESLGEDVSYRLLKKSVNHLINANFNDVTYYGKIMQQEIEKIVKKTNFELDKRIILVV